MFAKIPVAEAPFRRACLPLAAVTLALVTAVPGRARAGAVHGRGRSVRDYEKRIAEIEVVMDRHYRGEPIEDARTRLNALVDEYNALVETRNREMKAAEKRLDAELAPLKALEKRIEEMDRKLARKPDRTDADAVGAYNALVEERNALVERAGALGKSAQASIDAHNARVRRVKPELDAGERRLEARRAEFNARIDAREEFRKSERDVAFFARVNRLYGGAREGKRRAGRRSEWDRIVAKLRAVRRELGAHAVARHSQSEYGLIVVEAAVMNDEPCFFIVDTGAMLTTIAPGVVEALGLADRLGKETEFVLAGGKKMKGREIVLPRITVAGRTETDVPAAAVSVSEVGVDGLLGQSFLKRFVYTIDESREKKLILRPRRPDL